MVFVFLLMGDHLPASQITDGSQAGSGAFAYSNGDLQNASDTVSGSQTAGEVGLHKFIYQDFIFFQQNSQLFGQITSAGRSQSHEEAGDGEAASVRENYFFQRGGSQKGTDRPGIGADRCV